MLDYLVAKCDGRVLRDPIAATNDDVKNLPVPFTLWDVTTMWDETRSVCTKAEVTPIKVERWGVDASVGATLPSITFRDQDGRTARGSVDMFYLDRAEAELQVQLRLNGGLSDYSPSTSWAQGGPIIEREHITVEWRPNYGRGLPWVAHIPHNNFSSGATPLEAAMRCYVSSKLGYGAIVPTSLFGTQP